VLARLSAAIKQRLCHLIKSKSGRSDHQEWPV
jgi:hypothetical protein